MKLLSPRVTSLAIAVALGGSAVALAGARQNLALHRPVHASSILLGDPAGVVNGFVEWGTYALHSRSAGQAWFVIDLERTTPIGVVRIFGRGDGYHTDASSLIAVEVSTDGRTFKRAATCPAVATQVSPCRVDLGGVPASHVRLTHATHLVLSEVEVFAPR
jgi:F5/8 type C domain